MQITQQNNLNCISVNNIMHYRGDADVLQTPKVNFIQC